MEFFQKAGGGVFRAVYIHRNMDMKQALDELKKKKKQEAATTETEQQEGHSARHSLRIRALAISMLSAGGNGGRGAMSSSSSSSESESDDSEEEGNEDEEAKEKAKAKQREKLQKKFVKKLQSRSEVDSMGGSFAFPSLASSAVLKFKKVPSRPLRTLHKRSDPCLMGESQSLSSEDEDEKPNYGSMGNDANQIQNSQETTPTGCASDELDGGEGCDPELGFASTRDLKSQPSFESTGMDRLTVVDKETLVRIRQSRGGRSPSSVGVQDHQPHQQTRHPSRPRRSLHRVLLRLYGKINNSYFAYWLVVCSMVVIALDIIAIIFVKFAFESSHDKYGHRITQHRGLLEEKLDAGCDWRLMMLRGMHYVGIPNVLLVAPVLFSSDFFALYKSKDNRIVRCAYLHVCELIITAQMAFMIYFAADQVFNLPETIQCHQLYTASEIAMLYSSLVVWVVLMRQIVLFCRFITHQKLQADGANDANHTSQMSSWMKR